MANFPTGGAARGLARGLNIAESRKSRQFGEQQAQEKAEREKQEQLRKGIQERRDFAMENATQFAEFASQIAQSGGDPEQIEPIRNSAKAILTDHGSELEQLRMLAAKSGATEEELAQIPSGSQFVEQNMQLFDAAVQSAAIQGQSEQFEMVPPEEIEAAGLPEGAIAQRGPNGKIELLFEPSKDRSALDEKIEALTASGVDEERAMGIAAGRFKVSSNPITNEHVVLDVATGEQVGAPLEQPEPGEVPPIVPEGIDAEEATGMLGAIKNIGNIVTDAIGLGASSPKAQEATEALRTIQTLTFTTLQADVEGRNSVFLMQELKKLSVEPNSVLTGPERAKTRFKQTQRILDGEIKRMEEQVLPLELPPKKRSEIEQNLTQLRRLREAYDDLIGSFDDDGVGGEEEDGLDPEIQSLLDKYAPGRE